MIFNKQQTIGCGDRLLDLSTPVVMGILNVSPDSFYARSRVIDEKSIVARAGNIIAEGGTIIDVGAYSSRPGAVHVDAEEEYRRLKPAISLIKKHFPDTFLSVDTFRANIVKRLYEEFGCFIVNDISAGEADSQMIPYVGATGMPYIAMHMRGTPQTMSNSENCFYDNIILDMIDFFIEKKSQMRRAGIIDFIVDPGFGFAKNVEGNFELLACLDSFKVLECPILVGISRKSMFNKFLNITPEESLPATIAGTVIALQNGADILRVHDVREASDAIEIFKRVKEYSR
jgi:dihydropteroate synthase